MIRLFHDYEELVEEEYEYEVYSTKEKEYENVLWGYEVEDLKKSSKACNGGSLAGYHCYLERIKKGDVVYGYLIYAKESQRFFFDDGRRKDVYGDEYYVKRGTKKEQFLAFLDENPGTNYIFLESEERELDELYKNGCRWCHGYSDIIKVIPLSVYDESKEEVRCAKVDGLIFRITSRKFYEEISGKKQYQADTLRGAVNNRFEDEKRILKEWQEKRDMEKKTLEQAVSEKLSGILSECRELICTIKEEMLKKLDEEINERMSRAASLFMHVLLGANFVNSGSVDKCQVAHRFVEAFDYRRIDEMKREIYRIADKGVECGKSPENYLTCLMEYFQGKAEKVVKEINCLDDRWLFEICKFLIEPNMKYKREYNSSDLLRDVSGSIEQKKKEFLKKLKMEYFCGGDALSIINNRYTDEILRTIELPGIRDKKILKCYGLYDCSPISRKNPGTARFSFFVKENRSALELIETLGFCIYEGSGVPGVYKYNEFMLRDIRPYMSYDILKCACRFEIDMSSKKVLKCDVLIKEMKNSAGRTSRRW